MMFPTKWIANRAIHQLFFILVCILLHCATAFSQVTWDGGAMNTLWSNANNWNPDGVPTISDDVIIDGMVDVDIPSSFTATSKSLTVSNQANLYLNNTAILQIEGNASAYALTLDAAYVTNSGTIEISNCLSGIGLFGDGSSVSNTGSITVDNHNGYGFAIATGCTNCNLVTSSNMSFDNGTSSTSPAVYFGAGLADGNIIINSGTMNIGATAHVCIGIGLGPIGGYFINTGTLNLITTGGAGINSGFIPGIFANGSSGIVNFGAGIGGNWLGGFNLNLSNDGLININKSTAPANVVVTGSGVFGGTEAFSINNSVSPGTGSNAGCLLFNSGYSNTGVTNLDIGGTTQCSDLDALFGSGSLTVAGTLNITYINGFTPTAGQSLTLINAASLSGTYSTINFPSTPGIDWTTTYTGTSLTAFANAALPVELINFNAKLNENRSVRLFWRTATEHNNQGFYIEKSTDGIGWTAIGFAVGKGSVDSEQHYSFTDEQPSDGMNYYRLRQMDFDGKSELSRVEAVDNSGAASSGGLTIFPNPTTGLIGISADFPSTFEVLVFDATGKLVKRFSSAQNAHFDLSELENGLYCVTVLGGEKPITATVCKQN